MRKEVILDTSAVMEGVGLRQIEWRALAGAAAADDVVLIVSPAVVEELDRLKTDAQASRRERARKGNREIHDLFDAGGEVGVGIRLELVHAELDAEALKQKGLLWDRGDDRILGCAYARQGREVLADEFVLVGLDNSFLNRARSKGFKVLRLPEQYRRKDERDPQAEEIKRLKAELEEIKDTYPKLDLVFDGAADETTVSIGSQTTADFELLFLREHSRAQRLVLEQYSHMRGLLARQNEDQYLFGEFLKQQVEAMEKAERVSECKFAVRNQGHYAARDVRVTIYVPPEIEAVDPVIPFPEDHYAPNRHIYDKAMLQHMELFAARDTRLRAPERYPNPMIGGPTVSPGASITVAYRAREVSDLTTESLPPLNFLFGREGDEAVLKYEIVTSGVPRTFSGKMVIVINRRPRTLPPPPAENE